MNQTITITGKTFAKQLRKVQLSNFDSSQYYNARLVNPAKKTRPKSGKSVDPDLCQIMLASESILANDWNHPEEDAAWATL